ncbi:hypothetical protein P152DRAFT_124251 [Eremomyces bilateralis CBS 781.70]|uniref:Uncharacterized protein n=1 Tax=Eremomyces bilateralis CBS 781.70 TaxID=1392243 RepID=A0A6G1GEW8_9PEZI|nr:uncharacterized protein P152DRAFT_124251 [Eremomyces bilateralis CBS 781.70]KAF1816451.1 hypothetical protein P152DRAFT_124251 [Eremomyces bilateralis CBS 781.70]
MPIHAHASAILLYLENSIISGAPIVMLPGSFTRTLCVPLQSLPDSDIYLVFPMRAHGDTSRGDGPFSPAILDAENCSCSSIDGDAWSIGLRILMARRVGCTGFRCTMSLCHRRRLEPGGKRRKRNHIFTMYGRLQDDFR